MPSLGADMEAGTLVEWLKKPGDKVERDEPLFEISTDKVDAEIPSPAAGILREIRVAPGTTVAVNTVVGVIAAEAETAAAQAPAAVPPAPLTSEAPATAEPTPAAAEPTLAAAPQRAAQAFLAGAGYPDAFRHGIGHGIGLETHEPPSLKHADTPLEAGMVFSMEPGLYLPGEIGIRIEDIVVLEETGPRFLTEAPRHGLVVGERQAA